MRRISPADVAIVSAWVGPKPAEVDAVIKNHVAYSKRHGYKYIHYDNERISEVLNLVGNDADAHWIKPEVISRGLAHHKYVFWTDLDSVFHRRTKSLSDLVQLNKDFIFTGDHNDLCNAGHLFFRQSPWTIRFIRTWSKLRHVRFPKLHTTMQSPEGFVGDQIALNYLLGGGKIGQREVNATAYSILNRTNGWEGNPDREHRDFAERYAPVGARNLVRTKSLVSPALEGHVEVVVQHRLNAYPWWGPKKKKNKAGPIIHFVSPYKAYLRSYLAARGFLK